MTSDGAGLNLAVEHAATEAIVRVGGELEFATAGRLRTTLVDLAQRGTARVVIDLADVDFIDSTGISLLVQAKQRLDSQGGSIVLRAVNGRVQRVLEMTGLLDLFAVE